MHGNVSEEAQVKEAKKDEILPTINGDKGTDRKSVG